MNKKMIGDLKEKRAKVIKRQKVQKKPELVQEEEKTFKEV